MTFCALESLHSGVLGEWIAGRPTTIVVPTPNVMFHELSHEGLNQQTSLGKAAILCGLIDIYTEDGDPRRTPALEYLNVFYRKCGWIHEGAATARELVLAAVSDAMNTLPIDQVLMHRPESYIHAGADAFALMQALGTPFGMTGQDALRAMNAAVSVPAMVAMSPPLEEEAFASLVLGGSRHAVAALAEVWPRYVTLRSYLQENPAINELMRSALPPEGAEEYEWARSQRALATVLAQCARIQFGDAPPLEPFIQKYLADLADKCVVAPPATDAATTQKLVDHAFKSLLKPLQMKMAPAMPADIARIDPARIGPLRILELFSSEIDGHGVVVHCFNDDGSHFQSLVVMLGENPAGVMDALATRVPSAPPPGRHGLIVAAETAVDHLSAVVRGRPLMETALFGYGLMTSSVRKSLARTTA
jgi:hypothetical protein